MIDAKSLNKRMVETCRCSTVHGNYSTKYKPVLEKGVIFITIFICSCNTINQ